MKYYDYNKARSIIAEYQSTLKTSSLGIREDWCWTAETIWEDGKYSKHLFEGDIVSQSKIHRDVLAKRLEGIKDWKERFAIRDEFSKEFGDIDIAGICGSAWGTPQLMLEFQDGTQRAIEVSITDGDQESKGDRFLGLGCLSSPAQDDIESVPLEE